MQFSNIAFENKLTSTHSDNIKDKYRNKHYNRFNTMGKLEKYKTYEFINDGSDLIVKEYNHDMRKIKLKDLMKKCKSENKYIENGLPLPLTPHCKLIGVVDSKSRKSFVNKGRNYLKDDLLELFISKVDVNYVEDEFSNIKVFSGNWAHNSQNLIDMATPKKKIFSVSDIINGYLSRVNIDFKLPYIGHYDPKQILKLDIKPTAFPGFSTSQKIAKKKRDSTPYTKDYSYKYAKHIMTYPEQILDTSLLVVGGREKRTKFNIDEKGKRVKTRVTCMGEDVPTLISQSLVNPITNCIPEISDHFSQLAKVYGQGNMIRYVDSMKPGSWEDVLCDLDYSGHDNNTSQEQILVAFAMLRLCYDECEEIDKLFYYSMSSMIYKRIVLPESNLVYQINKGISTGHGFTSLITTMCAYGTLATALNNYLYKDGQHHYNEKEIKDYLNTSLIKNAGDDVNMRLNSELISGVYDYVLENSGHTIDDMRDNGYHQSNNHDSTVTLFKKQFQDFSWNERELFTNLVHPTISQKNFGHRADNLKVLMYQSPLNHILNHKMICLMICYIISGRGYSQLSMLSSQLDGRILSVDTFIDLCIDVGFDNPNFIDHLMSINYGSFPINIGSNYLSSKYKDKALEICRTNVNLTNYLIDYLQEIKTTLGEKFHWFTTTVRYKMHRQKNTLTVYDYMKISNKAKSSNISTASLLEFYKRISI